MASKISLSVIIPVYNSEDILPILAERLGSSLKEICSEYEVLLVNDGSEDSSWGIIEDLSSKYPFIRGINLMRNFGQHNALLCGIRAARFDYLVTMDDDLQHPPEEIYRLVDEIEKGFDVVYGIPHKLVHSPWRNISSKLTKSLLAKVLGINRIKYLSAFRIIRRDIRKAFDTFDSPSVIIDALLTWGTNNFGIVEVNEQHRSIGHSNYSLGKLIKVTMVVLTGFSTFPLRFASILGFAFTLFGIAVLVYVLARTFSEGSLPGFPFLASIVSIFSGVQLFTLGIFGEYLARIFTRSMNQPAYIIQGTSPDSIK
jgi:undecaprenyl-phosphate 4-deoxy-4-formamido-L-arabinose transferase